MNKTLTAALVAALVGLSVSAVGQEKKDAPPATAPPATTPPAAAQAPAAATPAPPPAEERGVVKDDEFIPTQDIPPDEGVTFPVGI